MKNQSKVLLIMLLIFIALPGCRRGEAARVEDSAVGKNAEVSLQTEIKSFSQPDKIVIYNEGKAKVVSNGDRLYEEMLNLTNTRIEGAVDIGGIHMAILKDDMDKLKRVETVIEFMYSEQQKNIGNRSQAYQGLIFPLTGHYDRYCFFEQGTNNYGGPISSLGRPDALMQLLKGL